MEKSALLLAGVILSISFVTPAQAEDQNWTGAFIGGQGGCGHVVQHVNYFNTAEGAFPGDFSGDFNGSGNGCYGGGLIGFDYQFANNMVIGISADFNKASIGSHGSFIETGGGDSYNQNLEAFGTLRGQVGYAFGQWLPYVTGGLAWGRNETSVLDDGGGGTSETQTHSGVVGGGGLQYAFNQNWSVKGEYLYMDLGSRDYALNFDDENPPGSNLGLKVQTFSVAISYKFW